ncbi:Hypothetical protein CINCED_3A013179 [Cinara cedri]|uniref:Bax inhibitor 1-related n=1 Tax=Cinara cedri TaxID=506608 RepID=A0A5E4MNH8_9HEMI|nr:Hypothetical protein CINCED_3A013179 [Cinara cedri]
MESSDKCSQSLEKEQMHDVMIYIDDNDIDVKYNNSSRDKSACNSGRGPEENVCPNVVIPLVEIRDVSNGVIPNPPSEESNHSKKNIRLKGGDDNNPNFNLNSYADQFQSKQIRTAFIKKVYSIILIMLVVVALPSFIFNYSNETREFQEKYLMLIAVESMFVFLVTFYALTCYEYVRKSVPTNLIVLTLYIDITKFGILITVMGMIIFIFTLITYFFLILYYHEIKLAQLIMGAVGVFIFSIFLAYNTQMVLGGGKYEITPDEYILAVVVILTNIVDIFWSILLLMSGLEK